MDTQFKDLVKQAVQEHGMKILEDSRGCKSALADYAHGEYGGEIRLLTTVLEAGFYQEFASNKNHDTDLVRSKFLRRLYTHYSLDETKATEMVDFLLGTMGIVVVKKPVLVQQSVSSAAMNVSTSSAAIHTGAVPAGFVRIEGGTFMMGSNSGESYEKPVHQVTISKAFYMGKHEVTQNEWVEVMGSNPSYFKGDSLPVEQVSWFDAVEYCNKRSIKEGLTPAYRGSENSITCNFRASGFRLPTEAEWEFAAKGGTQEYLTTEYAGSNSADVVGWYGDNSEDKTHNVGTKQANSLGLYDMSGNVFEWCWDWYGVYSGRAQTNPLGAASGSSRVLRGGSWYSYAQYLRSACRSVNTPSIRHGDIGFRLVRP
jgi:formylglycine-generating enzyme required for sulfatase activity